MDEGVRILELARNAQALFERQPAREKRRLLNFILSNCTWEDGEVVAIFRQPFDLLAETNTAVAHLKAGNGGNSSKNEIWLCRRSRANLSPPNFPIVTVNGQGILRELTRLRSKERETIVVRLGERPKKAVFTARRSQASAPRVFDSACSAFIGLGVAEGEKGGGRDCAGAA